MCFQVVDFHVILCGGSVLKTEQNLRRSMLMLARHIYEWSKKQFFIIEGDYDYHCAFHLTTTIIKFPYEKNIGKEVNRIIDGGF